MGAGSAADRRPPSLQTGNPACWPPSRLRNTATLITRGDAQIPRIFASPHSKPSNSLPLWEVCRFSLDVRRPRSESGRYTSGPPTDSHRRERRPPRDGRRSGRFRTSLCRSQCGRRKTLANQLRQRRAAAQTAQAAAQRLGDAAPFLSVRIWDNAGLPRGEAAVAPPVGADPAHDLPFTEPWPPTSFGRAEVLPQELGQRQSSTQTAQAVAHRIRDARPPLAVGVGNYTRLAIGIFAVAAKMLVDPTNKQLLAEIRQMPPVPPPAVLHQDQGDRVTAWQSSLAQFECGLDHSPRFVLFSRDGSRFRFGPSAGALLVCIGPIQNLRDREQWFAHIPPDAAPLEKQPRQGPAAAQTAKSPHQLRGKHRTMCPPEIPGLVRRWRSASARFAADARRPSGEFQRAKTAATALDCDNRDVRPGAVRASSRLANRASRFGLGPHSLRPRFRRARLRSGRSSPSETDPCVSCTRRPI